MQSSIDDIRSAALARADRAELHYRLGFFGAVALETAFLAGFLALADLSNRLHVLLFMATIAIYSIVALGLVALGAHVTRCTLRVIRAIEARE